MYSAGVPSSPFITSCPSSKLGVRPLFKGEISSKLHVVVVSTSVNAYPHGGSTVSVRSIRDYKCGSGTDVYVI